MLKNDVSNRRYSCDSFAEINEELEKTKPKPRSWIGFIFAVLASCSAPLGALFIKLSNGDAMQIVLLRCVTQYMTLLPVITYKKIELKGENWKSTTLLVLNGIFALMSMATFTNSFNYLSLGDGMAIFFTFPALVGLFACLCLKEKCSILSVGLTVVTLGGVVLIAEPSFIFGEPAGSEQDPALRILGIFLGLVGSISIALTCVIVRQLGPKVHFSHSVFYYSLEGVIVMPIYLAVTGKMTLPCLQDLPSMFAGGLGLYLCQIFVTLALQRERAGPVSLVLTSQIIISFLLQLIVFGELPTVLGGIGAALIVASSVVLALTNVCRKH